jgi:hypothetical protein
MYMSAAQTPTMEWKVRTTAPAKLSNEQWTATGLLGLVLIASAILQLVNFSDFKDSLTAMGIAGPTAWGVCIVIAELWGAAGFFKLRLSYLFRAVSAALAVLVAGFWFVENLQVISGGLNLTLTNSGFFGRFLTQKPGWWTVVEVTILLFWTLYAVGLNKEVLAMPKRK